MPLMIAALALSVNTATPPETTAAPPPPAVAPPTVVVTGRRARERPCAAKDKDCITAVAAEIWRLYPERVKDWCMKVEVNRERAQYNAGSSGGPTMGGDMPSTPYTSPDASVPEAERVLCTYKPESR